MEIETPEPGTKPFYQEETLGDALLPVKMLRGGVLAGRLVAPHWHTFMEILYFLEGGVELTLNATRYQITAGDAVLLNGMDIHAMKGEASFLVLEIAPGLTDDIRMPLRELFPSDDACKVVRARENDRTGMQSTLAEQMPAIADAFDTRTPGYELDIRGRIYLIAAALVRYAAEPAGPVAGERPARQHSEGRRVSDGEIRRRDIARLEDLLAYLREHIREPLTSREAARLLNYDESYFCRFFKRMMGMPFQRYLTLFRCARAEELLRGTSLSVAEIARHTGFSSGSHLTASDRRCMGVTPAEERAGRA